ncbi:MAG: hypothetical protein PF545_05240, partial [Elusimicrobia bacterium]|nr:hypothetical protein [Elusimicrobiota bacterium]
MNYPKIFTGAILFFAIDYILLWKYAILYPAFFTTLCGIIILGISSRETLPKISYYFTAVIILLFTLSSGPKIVTSSLKKLNPDNDKTILSYQYTPYGETALHNKKSQYEASLNHARLFKIPDTQRMQETAHMTLLQYPWAEKILVIGGNKILVEEILKYPDIKSLYWASVVPGYFDFIAEAEDNPDSYSQDIRLRKIKNTDPRDFIRNISANNIFDVAIISVPDPFNLLFNRYYSYDFFLELRSIMSDYSITSLDLAAGEKFSGEERKILAASVYNTLKEVFPNTLEMYGEKSQILASHNRNFTTSYPALSEFLNTLESMPGFVSPALIRYKLNSNRQVKQYIQNTLAPLNTDIRPASLKYSFTLFIFTLSITPKLFLRYINRATPLIIYSIFAVMSLFLIIIFQHKPLEYKLQFHRFCIVLLFGIFIYIIAVSVHITTGKIYSRLSAILLFITTGILLGRA